MSNVLPFHSARRTGSTDGPEIPADAMRAVDLAAHRAQLLADRGQEIHFEAGGAAGKVLAELRVIGGKAIRAVALHEVVGDGGDGPPSAA
jgi:hypothetical protein